MRALAHAFEEAVLSLRRTGRSAAMSVGTIAIAFLTLGGFLLTAANLQGIAEQWAASAEMSIYLRDDASEDAVRQLSAELTAHHAVNGVEYVSKQAALSRFGSDFPELADVAKSMEDNPFPASLEVRLKGDAASAAAAERLAGELGRRDTVSDVRYDRRWLARLLDVVAAIRGAGIVVAAILVLGAAFTVAAVVRLSLVARRDELEIMELVGAPFSFIRGPAIAEGTLLGGIGAGLGLLILWAAFQAFRGQIGDAIGGFVGVSELRFLGVRESLMLIATALGVGALAGMVASRVA